LKRLVIVGAGFAGLECARRLGGSRELELTLVDRRNHHVFQPLLYQVAMAELSPADIAAPIRSVLSKHRNIRVLAGEAVGFDLARRVLRCDFGELPYDSLVVATGAQHAYFGHEDWERFAPGLKTLEQATEIRRRVLQAFEDAERTSDPVAQRRLLSFVIVGAGPTGVELAGAIGEMARYTLARDFRRIEPALTRVVLVEAGPRVLATFKPDDAAWAVRALGTLGVEVRCGAKVTAVDADGVALEAAAAGGGAERIDAATVLWAAGVQPSPLGALLGVPLDGVGRVKVAPDLSVAGHPEVFVAGDLAHCLDGAVPLPGTADVAQQQGRFLADLLGAEARAAARGATAPPRAAFRYRNLGSMATIGRDKAIADFRSFSLTGYFAWLGWVLLHIYRLLGFRNRMVVLTQWAWSYWTNRRGARLILGKDWRAYPSREPSKEG
jgi:NADH dehydrogenase